MIIFGNKTAAIVILRMSKRESNDFKFLFTSHFMELTLHAKGFQFYTNINVRCIIKK